MTTKSEIVCPKCDYELVSGTGYTGQSWFTITAKGTQTCARCSHTFPHPLVQGLQERIRILEDRISRMEFNQTNK